MKKETNQALLDGFLDFLDLDLTETLDLQECSAGGTVDGLNRETIVSAGQLHFSKGVGVRDILPRCRSHLLSVW
jgi:hypothetical protein